MDSNELENQSSAEIEKPLPVLDRRPLRGKRRKRSSRFPVVLSIAVLLVGLSGFFWAKKMQERTEFVSDVERTTGYRCRFTIGAGWKHSQEDSLLMVSSDLGNPPDRFSPPPPNPLLQWISLHLLHRPTPQSEPAAISLFVEATGSPAEAPLQNGYPEFPEATPPLSKRYLIIDGCRSTLATYPYSGTSTGHETHLLICTPDHKVIFQFIAYSSMQGDQTDRELQEIIRSFHMEQVAAPSGKKGGSDHEREAGEAVGDLGAVPGNSR